MKLFLRSPAPSEIETPELSPLMKKRNIVITEEDRAQLSLMMEVTAPPLTERPNAQALEHELRRAEIVATDSVPPDVITMNSRAELLDLDTGEHLDLTLVFPSDANIDE